MSVDFSFDEVGSKVSSRQGDGPIAILGEYVADANNQVRKNTATALVVIAGRDQRSLDLLVDMLFNEQSHDVLAHIQNTILELPTETADALLERLCARRESPKRWLRIGQLRLKGVGRGHPEALEALIRLAVDATNRKAQASAIAALASLDHHERDMAGQILLRFLKGGEEKLVRATYHLLGALRLRGSLLGYPSVLHGRLTSSQLRDAKTLRRVLKNRWSRTFGSWGPRCLANEPEFIARRRASFGFMWTMVGWGAIGAIVVAMHLSTSVPPPVENFYPVFVISVSLASAVLGYAATRSVTPIYVHYGRAAAGIRDAFAAAVRCLGPTMLGLGLVLFWVGFNDGVRGWLLAVIAPALGVCIFVAAIRGGTAAAFGLLPPRHKWVSEHLDPVGRLRALPTPLQRSLSAAMSARQPRRESAAHPFGSSRSNFVVQVAVGTSCGLIVAFALLAAARMIVAASGVQAMSRLPEGLWMFLLPTAAAIAVGFAWIDEPGTDVIESVGAGARFLPPEAQPAPDSTRQVVVEERLHNVARIASALLVVPLLVALVTIVQSIRSKEASTALVAESGKRLDAPRLSLNTLPAVANFGVAFPQQVHLHIPQQPDGPPESEDEPDFMLTLFEWTPTREQNGVPDCTDSSTKREMMTRDDPPEIERLLGRGCYAVEVTTTVPEVNRLSVIADVLDSRVAQISSDNPWKYWLEMGLNSDQRKNGGYETDVSTGSGVWVVKRVPEEITLNLPSKALARFFLSSFEVQASTAVDAGDANDQSTRGRRDTEPVTVEIWKGDRLVDDDALTRRVVLDDGAIVLKVRPRTGTAKEVVNVALNMVTARPSTPRVESQLSPLPPLATAKPGEKLEGYWRIGDELPASYPFRVSFPQQIALRFPAVGFDDPFEDRSDDTSTTDWYLEVREDREASRDSLATLLDGTPLHTVAAGSVGSRLYVRPGNYRLVVLTRTQRSRARATGAYTPYVVPDGAASVPFVELKLNTEGK